VKVVACEMGVVLTREGGREGVRGVLLLKEVKHILYYKHSLTVKRNSSTLYASLCAVQKTIRHHTFAIINLKAVYKPQLQLPV
jgi:hypothetical protein